MRLILEYIQTRILCFCIAKTTLSKISATLIMSKIDDQSLNSNRLFATLYNKTPCFS